MKNLSIIVGSIAFLFNVILGLMTSGYETFNCVLNSGIIVVSVLLLCAASSHKLRDGFKISLGCLFPVFFIAEIICGCLASNQIKDNLSLIIILLLVIVQVVMLVLANYSSKNIK